MLCLDCVAFIFDDFVLGVGRGSWVGLSSKMTFEDEMAMGLRIEDSNADTMNAGLGLVW